jgi:mono/diheme cytochrome c family protein
MVPRWRKTLHQLAKLAVISLLILATESSAFCRPDGKSDYAEMCAQCHGPTGTGEGRNLTEATPPDLTLLSRNNGGKFPFEHVYRIVDGREMTESHRRAAMPFWGQIFQKPGQKNTSQSDGEAKAEILGLVEYIRTLQKK